LAPLALGLPLILPFSLSGQQLLRSLREGKVTAIIGVPRLYSALYSGIEAKVKSSGWMAPRLFRLFLAASGSVRNWLGLRVGKLLFRSLHKRFGENLRLLASGGSALDPELAWKLEALGWQVAIGYGLTETSPLLTVKLPDRLPPDSAGKPVAGVEIGIQCSEVVKEERVNGDEVGDVVARGADSSRPVEQRGYKRGRAQVRRNSFKVAAEPSAHFRLRDHSRCLAAHTAWQNPTASARRALQGSERRRREICRSRADVCR